MNTKRFEMRLDPSILEQLDAWRSNQPDLPSRAESVRRLVNAGLAQSGNQKVRISVGEELIMMMIRDLYHHLKVDGEIDPDFVSKALGGGHYWALDWKYDGLSEDNMKDPRLVSEVAEVLTMWSFIENGYASLSESDKKRVTSETGLDGEDVRFQGFDGNEESDHFFVARFMIDDLNRFKWFQGRELNSHWPRVAAYRRMLSAFESNRAHIMGRTLSASEIIDLIDAWKR